MTKKDRTMIFVMLIILIVGGGYKFLILPALDEKDALIVQLAEAQAEYDTVKLEVDSLPMYYNKFIEVEEELVAMYPTLDDYREEEDVDRYFTQVVELASIELNTMTIASNDVTFLDDQLITKGFVLTLTGSVENTIALIHTLQNTKDVRIDVISLSGGTEEGESEETSITISGEVYMKIKKY